MPTFCFAQGFITFLGLSSFSRLFCFFLLLRYVLSLPRRIVRWSDWQTQLSFNEMLSQVNHLFYVCLFAFNSLQPMQPCLIWQLLSEVYLAESNFAKSAQTPDSWELHVVEFYLVTERVTLQWEFCKLKLKTSGVWYLSILKISPETAIIARTKKLFLVNA